MELYSSFMKLAPLVLLKLLGSGGFGSSGRDNDERGLMAFAGDVALVVAVVVGGVLAVLVLGDVVAPTVITRGVLVVAGCLSLLVLATYTLRQVASLHGVRPRPRPLVGRSGDASTYPGESS
jgi:hypothetical protein